MTPIGLIVYDLLLGSDRERSVLDRHFWLTRFQGIELCIQARFPQLLKIIGSQICRPTTILKTNLIPQVVRQDYLLLCSEIWHFWCRLSEDLFSTFDLKQLRLDLSTCWFFFLLVHRIWAIRILWQHLLVHESQWSSPDVFIKVIVSLWIRTHHLCPKRAP